MGVLIADADGRHRARIPDGQLCSAGNRPDFGVYDLPSDQWLATELAPGPQTFRWTLNAPHASRYYRFYITKPGYDPTRPLRWDDLELLHDSGPRGAAKAERFDVTVPERTGRHVIYSIWQRSDSPEAFYACSDVVFGQPGQVPKGIRLRRRIDTDWGTGYCATVTVANRSRRARVWKGAMPMPDTITGLWNARHRVRNGRLRVRGESYNARLAPRATTTFGYCATR